MMENDDYSDMCLRLLNNQQWYKKISLNLVQNYISQNYKLLDGAYNANIINKPTWQHIKNKNPKTHTFYSLPKMHKQSNGLTGRPIVSGAGSLTEHGSQLVDAILKPHLQTLFFHIKDTTHFFQTIDSLSIPKDAYLVTIDVECLYNSIPQRKGVEITKSYLDQMHESALELNTFILELLEIVLTHIYFLFDGSLIFQVQRVAMETSCAPSYANLYLGGQEHQIFSKDDDLVKYLGHAMTWHRCIDNIFVVWDGPLDLLHQ